MANQPAPLNQVFYALSDPTRRAVVQRLGIGSAPVSELAEPFDMTLPSFMQHLDILENCGLVRSQKKGRVRVCQLTPRPLEAIDDWMTKQRGVWKHRLNRLDHYLPTMKEKHHEK